MPSHEKFLIIVPDAENVTNDDGQQQEDRNDLLLVKQPTATTRQYSLQVVPFKGHETSEKIKPKEATKLDGKYGKSGFYFDMDLSEPLQVAQTQSGAGLIGESADAIFIPLDCPQSGVHNYSQLLNCLEVGCLFKHLEKSFFLG